MKRLHEALALPDALDLAHVVHREVDVLELPQLVQTLHLRDQVALQVQDFEVPAVHVQVLYFFQVLLVQRDLHKIFKFVTLPLQGWRACIRCAQRAFLGAPK